ncbi:MAG TPA: 4-(cytidine 5'-diphospho)-2-C-methyl-D-erythritol kinase [Pyrinomonadaceae bacterium]|nr:4-(cytidine 5'-diphospho)-2-C-methyl-D-erythritol kinase [Pyrinomonadaceae bacterium]
MSDERFTLPAFAKINLGLRVLGRRPDGYHEIRTVFQTVTLRDRLTFESLPGGRLELACDAADVPADESNLVHRAAVALRERFGVRVGARVELEKTIPPGAGLGGGSSDAAAALLGFARLWRLGARWPELREAAAGLGADVPFFLTGGTALGEGTGAEITPLADAPERHLLIVTPGVKVSTAEAYKALNARALTKADRAANLSVSRAESQIRDSLRGVVPNDFEAAVFGLHPEIGRAREALAAAGAAGAALSGSGSSVYGFFESEGEAERARASLRAEPGWRVFRCATLTRGAYAAAFGPCAAGLRAAGGA